MLGLDPDSADHEVLREVGARYLSQPFKRGEKMDSPGRTAARLQARWGAEAQEHFVALALDSRLRVVREVVVAKGGLSEVHVRPREVFRPLILDNAASAIVAHNHPSGDAEPSAEDVELTRRLVTVGETLGIPVMDHLVITRDRYVSLLERGVVPGALSGRPF